MQIIEPKYFMLNCKYIKLGLSYEDYLIDILNSSAYFRNKSLNNSKYYAPKSQDNGESDAYSSGYQIDFKLLVDEGVMWCLNKNRPTVDKKYINHGIIIVNDKPSPVAIPRKNILSDIMSITSEEITNDSFSSNTIKHFINNLNKDKNLFLYYPYEYIGETFPVNALANMMTQIFKTPLCYRKRQHPNKDTFICIKVNYDFYIFEWVDQEFIYRDSVNEILCSTYMDYKQYSIY